MTASVEVKRPVTSTRSVKKERRRKERTAPARAPAGDTRSPSAAGDAQAAEASARRKKEKRRLRRAAARARKAQLSWLDDSSEVAAASVAAAARAPTGTQPEAAPVNYTPTFIVAKIGGVRDPCTLADSGSNQPLLTPKFLNRLRAAGVAFTMVESCRVVKGLGGVATTLLGHVRLPLEVAGGKLATVKFGVVTALVGNVQTLIGTAELREMRAKLDFDKLTVKVGKQKIPMSIAHQAKAKCARLHQIALVSDVVVPRCSKRIALGHLVGRVASAPQTLLVEGHKLPEYLSAGSALTRVREGAGRRFVLDVELANNSFAEYTFKKGTVVAWAEEVDAVYKLDLNSARAPPHAAGSGTTAGEPLAQPTVAAAQTGAAAPPTGAQDAAREERRKDEEEVARQIAAVVEDAKQRHEKEGAPLSRKQLEDLRALLTRFKSVFANQLREAGRADIPAHDIDTFESRPVFIRGRRFSREEERIAQEEIAKMARAGVAERAPAGTAWSSPVVMVRKKTGEIRFCVDYRALNAVTKRDVYPLPRIDDILAKLKGAKYFSTLDMVSGYWQTPINRKDREKTAFSTSSGVYIFNVLPMGLCNAPASFQRSMDAVLGSEIGDCCFVYLDDVIIFSASWDEHLAHTERVLARLAAKKLLIKLTKCKFARHELLFLGHIVSAQGVKVNPALVETVRAATPPRDKKALQRVLGTLGYYRSFVPHFAERAHPMSELLGKRVPFVWGEQQQRSFEDLKDALLRAPLLLHPDAGKPFEVWPDASVLAIGAVLVQKDEQGHYHPVAYGSRTLGKHEQQYTMPEKECLAIVHFVTKQWRQWLHGPNWSVVLTDHQALTTLRNCNDLTGRLARWDRKLSEYNLKVAFRPGKENVVADALSREPFARTDEVERAELKPMLNWLDNIAEPAAARGLGPAVLVGAAGTAAATGATTAATAAGTAAPGRRPRRAQASRRVRRARKRAVASGTVLAGEGSLSAEAEVGEPGGLDAALTQWAKEQRADEELKKAFTLLEGGEADPSWGTQETQRLKSLVGQLHINETNNCLYQADDGVDILSQEKHWRLVVPRACKEELMKQYHEGMSGGHRSYDQNLYNLRRKYWWPNMGGDVRLYAKSCQRCQERSDPRGKHAGLLQPWPVPEAPGQEWAIDVIAMGTSLNGYVALVVMIDRYSRYVELEPIKEKSAATLIEAFIKHVPLVHGVPRLTVRDNGRELENEANRRMHRAFGIRKVTVTAYHPQANGMVERANKSLIDTLSKVCSDDKKDWCIMAKYAQFAHNASVCASTGFSPYFLQFGRDPCIGQDVVLGAEVPFSREMTPRDRAAHRVMVMERAFSVVQVAILESQERMRKAYDKDRKKSDFTEGDAVGLYRPQVRVRAGTAKKLCRPWKGPYRIRQLKGPGLSVAEVVNINNPKDRQTVSVHRLKYWITRAEDLGKAYDEEDFEIDAIENERTSAVDSAKKEYFVLRKDFGMNQGVWVREEDMNAPDLLEAWDLRQPGGVERKQKADEEASKKAAAEERIAARRAAAEAKKEAKAAEKKKAKAEKKKKDKAEKEKKALEDEEAALQQEGQVGPQTSTSGRPIKKKKPVSMLATNAGHKSAEEEGSIAMFADIMAVMQ